MAKLQGGSGGESNLLDFQLLTFGLGKFIKLQALLMLCAQKNLGPDWENGELYAVSPDQTEGGVN
jgi:hypothetical protein